MSNDDTQALPDEVKEQFRRLFSFIEPPQAAERIWNRVLTVADRERLGGDFRSAWCDGGTMGMWIRLNVSEPRAIVELAEAVGFVGPPTRDWLLREAAEFVAQPSLPDTDEPKPQPSLPGMEASHTAPQASLPVWDREALELKLDGRVIRRVKRPRAAINIMLLLGVFQEEGWPRAIYDPLPNGADPPRLHETIRSLNDGLERIRFGTDGSGRRCKWDYSLSSP